MAFFLSDVCYNQNSRIGGINLDKKQLRKEIICLRDALSVAERNDKAEIIIKSSAMNNGVIILSI